jgi:hypothetical protein
MYVNCHATGNCRISTARDISSRSNAPTISCISAASRRTSVRSPSLSWPIHIRHLPSATSSSSSSSRSCAMGPPGAATAAAVESATGARCRCAVAKRAIAALPASIASDANGAGAD